MQITGVTLHGEGFIEGNSRGIFDWYDFADEDKLLYIGENEDAVPAFLRRKGVDVSCILADELTTERISGETGAFDYVISLADAEHVPEPEAFLVSCRTYLKPDGTLLLAMNNRMGLKYFCGDRDLYTGRNFDGIENYKRAYSKKEDAFAGRMYMKSEIRRMLLNAGFERVLFYSLLPDIEHPTMIYRDGYVPNESIGNRISPVYNYPGTVFLEEEPIYDDLIANGMFHQMANAYIAECPLKRDFSDVLQVTSSIERGARDAMTTVVRSCGVVEKRAVYPEGQQRLEKLVHNGEELKKRGIPVLDATIINGIYTTPYCEGEVGQLYLTRLLYSDKDRFFEAFDELKDLIMNSSEIEKEDCGDGEGAILSRAYLDMVPLNSFYRDGKFIFFDQEFCEEHYPANVVLTRMIASFYFGNPAFHKLVPQDVLYERYGLLQNKSKWLEMEWKFLGRLINYDARLDDLRLHQRNADTRKLILFGAGKFAKKFISIYGDDYPVYAIIDNSKENQGTSISGIPVYSPDYLKQLGFGE